MNTLLIVAIGLLFLTGFILVIIFFRMSRRKKSYSREVAFAEALSYLLAGNKTAALEKLQALVKKDTSNVDAYTKIGDLYREMGQPLRAAKIHQDLTVRSGLIPVQLLQIYRSLVLDNAMLGNYPAAIHYCDRLLALDKSDPWIKQKKLEFLEKRQAWHEAYDLLHHHSSLFDPEETRQKLAYYKVQEGQQLAANNKEHNARVKFREAMKVDRNYPDAYFYLADSYLRSSRPKDAIKWLRQFLETVPENLDLVSDRIERILIETGEFSEIEKIYQQVIENKPQAINPRLAMAKIYDKKGELRQAIQLYREVLSQNPGHNTTRCLLFRSLVRLGNEDAALKIAAEIVDDYLAQHT